jgi:hypothetical protein
MITDEMRSYRNLIKYKVDNMDILFKNGDIVTIGSSWVTHLYIEKDFDNLYFPIFNISVVIKDELYDRINRENETVQFRLRIVKNIYDSDNKLLQYELYCNKLFRCFMDKETIIKDNEQAKDKKETEETESANYRSNPRNFYLFTDDVLNCKNMFNLSIRDADLTDLVIYLLGESKITNVLMSKLDNKEHIKDLILPNGNLIDTLNYLNELKGFYKKGMLLFFDIDCAYLIDKNALCTSWRRNEVRVTHIHVANQKNSDSQLNGQFINKDRKQTHVFAHTERVQMSNKNILNDQIVGNAVTVIDAKTNTVTNIKTNSTQIGNANTNLLSTKSSNMYTLSSIETRMLENEYICNMAFIGLDIDVFSPNKELLITYEDPELNKKYSGNYRLSKVTATLKKDADELVGEIQVTLKKQK